MFLKPCYNCPHKPSVFPPRRCEIKEQKLAAIRGHGFTSANFKCDKRLSTLQPGQRVKLEIWSFEEEGGWDLDSTEDTYLATVMRESKGRILVWLDKPTSKGRNPIRVRPDGVTPIEGTVALCSECGQPDGTEGRKGDTANGVGAWDCWKCEGHEDPFHESRIACYGP